MWFNRDLDFLFNDIIEPAVKAAGYKALRIDKEPSERKVCDQIIAEIRKSKAVIVDLTCGLAVPNDEIRKWSNDKNKNEVGAPRGGVFYEAGFAHGLGLPIIWMVEQKIADIDNVSHFDIRQYEQIRWDKNKIKEVKDELTFRIERILGEGPHKNN